MPYVTMTYEELLNEVRDMLALNANTLESVPDRVQALNHFTQGTDLEGCVRSFNHQIVFFRRIASLFEEELLFQLEQQNITYGLVNRMESLGREAFGGFTDIRRDSDVEREGYLLLSEEERDQIRSVGREITDNLFSISTLEPIAQAINQNHRFVTPIGDLTGEDIALQTNDGITISANDEIYVDGQHVNLVGQRKRVLMLLIQKYAQNRDLTASWMEIEEDIREEVPIERGTVVNRISETRTRLNEIGFGDVIEIKSVGRGLDASWRLIKS